MRAFSPRTFVCLALSVVSLSISVTWAGTNSSTDELPAIFTDRSLYNTYGPGHTIGSEKMAQKAKSESLKRLSALNKAFDEAKEACLKDFFVEHCVNRYRKAYFERKRELHKVTVAADEVIRLARLEKANALHEKERRERPLPKPIVLSKPKLLTQPHEPMVIAKPHLKEPSKPMKLREFEPKSDPAELDAKARHAQEAANVALYEAKQKAAQERRIQADSEAQERREKREAKQKEIQERLERRVEAQERYEKKMNERSSSILKFF